MEQTTGVAVLATHLVTDRRALSQAWYSALHLAEPSPRPRTPSQRVAPSKAMAQRRTESSNSALGRMRRTCAGTSSGAGSLRSRGDAARADSGVHVSERRVLARRIAHDVARGTADHTTRSFAMRLDGGRVHVFVRGDGARIRIVAVCAEALRSRVERALAQARFALAGRGLRAEAA